jgi:hypothetical protein
MKKTITILASILLLNISYGQKKPELSFGSTIKINKKKVIEKDILGSNENGYYIVTKMPTYLVGKFKKITLEHYNKDLTLDFQKEIILPEINDKKVTFFKVIEINSNLYIISFQPNKKSKENNIYAHKISPEGDINSDYILLGKSGYDYSPDLDIVYSEDKSKLMIYEKYDQKYCTIVDDNLKVIWSSYIKVPFSHRYVRLQNVLLDNSGSAFFAFQLIPEDKKTVEYKILNYEEGSTKIIDCPNTDYRISSLKCSINESKKKLLIGGFYSNNQNNIEGFFSYKYDLEHESYSFQNTFPFNIDLMNYLKSRKSNSLKDLLVKDILLKKDGSIIMIGEQNWNSENTSTTTTTTTTTSSNTANRANKYAAPATTSYSSTSKQLPTTSYYSNDIVAIEITKEATLKWMHVIPKKSISTVPFFLSYTYFLDKDENTLSIIYNDNPKNIATYKSKTGDVKILNAGINTNCTIASIINGKITRTKLFSNKEKKKYLRPSVFIKNSNSSIVVVSAYSSYFSLVEISF